MYCPSDESGDSHLFSVNLAKHCEERGVRFFYDTAVEALEVEGDRVTAVRCANGRQSADHYVLALGNQSADLARTLGVKLPIYPVKGYSVTLPVESEHEPPALGGVDEDSLVAYARPRQSLARDRDRRVRRL